MSQHPSLRMDSVGAKHRNVLKRFERIKKLQEQNKWQDRLSVFGLPKVRSVKVKVKKTKEKPTAEGATQGAAAGAPKTAAAPAGKQAAPAAASAAKAAAPKGDKAKK